MPVVETEPYRASRLFIERATGQTYPSIADIPGRRGVDPRTLPVFLRLGYVPGTATLWEGVDLLPGGCRIETAPGGWKVLSKRRFADEIDRERWARTPWDELVRVGGQLLVEAAAARLEPGSRPIVPLSGGLDSRALLGCLREQRESASIETFTYGTPGGLDFDVGNLVGRAAGTRHLALDLRTAEITADALAETARRTGANTDLFQPVQWTRVLGIYGPEAVYWSGYTGDGVGGSFWRPDGPPDGSVAAFLRFESRSIPLVPASEQDNARDAALVDADPKWRGTMSHDEAVWFENHVERYTAHHIFFDGARYALPFMDDAFVRFMLSVPPEHRRDKRLFDAIVTARFPDLFRLPTAGYGYKLAGRRAADLAWRARLNARKIVARASRGRLATHPGTTYLDFADGIRRRPGMRALVRGSLDALAARDIVDRELIERTWREHEAGKERRFALTLLASLEHMLRALADA